MRLSGWRCSFTSTGGRPVSQQEMTFYSKAMASQPHAPPAAPAQRRGGMARQDQAIDSRNNRWAAMRAEALRQLALGTVSSCSAILRNRIAVAVAPTSKRARWRRPSMA